MKLLAMAGAMLLAGAGMSFGQSSSTRFEPKLSIGAPPPALYGKQQPAQSQRRSQAAVKHAPAAATADTEIVCGMKVIRKGPEQDPGIIVQRKHSDGLAVRRIQPPICSAPR